MWNLLGVTIVTVCMCVPQSSAQKTVIGSPNKKREVSKYKMCGVCKCEAA